MYIKFNKDEITDEQLTAIKEILECEVDLFYNIHHEVCKYEVECVIENSVELPELEAIKQREDYEEIINEFANNLYYKADYQWDQLYEKAEYVVDIDDIVDNI